MLTHDSYIYQRFPSLHPNVYKCGGRRYLMMLTSASGFPHFTLMSTSVEEGAASWCLPLPAVSLTSPQCLQMWRKVLTHDAYLCQQFPSLHPNVYKWGGRRCLMMLTSASGFPNSTLMSTSGFHHSTLMCLGAEGGAVPWCLPLPVVSLAPP